MSIGFDRQSSHLAFLRQLEHIDGVTTGMLSSRTLRDSRGSPSCRQFSASLQQVLTKPIDWELMHHAHAAAVLAQPPVSATQ
jgi:hypothetical protein